MVIAKINVGRVIMGGVLAGAIISALEILKLMIWVMAYTRGMTQEIGNERLAARAFPALIPVVFVIGIVGVWIYASIRAHYGPGPRTAVIAGVVTWILGSAIPNYAFWAVEVFTGPWMAIGLVTGLVQLILAILAGAWVYQPKEAIVAIEPGVSS